MFTIDLTLRNSSRILSLFTHHDIPNLYEVVFSIEHPDR